jgi:nicotinate-nucleotide adenylyltransferase
LAIAGDNRFKASAIEFSLPRPSYTENTLKNLRATYPEYSFTLIIGGDNLKSFHKWKNYEQILDQHEVFVYARVGIIEKPLLANHPKIKMLEVPLLNISSTYIRETLQAGKSIRYMVPDAVRLEIEKQKYYR